MPASMSFQQIIMQSLGMSSFTNTIVNFLHQRSINRHKYNLFWVLISLNIFIVLVHCNDDTINPSMQPFPQKRAGGKF